MRRLTPRRRHPQHEDHRTPFHPSTPLLGRLLTLLLKDRHGLPPVAEWTAEATPGVALLGAVETLAGGNLPAAHRTVVSIGGMP